MSVTVNEKPKFYNKLSTPDQNEFWHMRLKSSKTVDINTGNTTRNVNQKVPIHCVTANCRGVSTNDVGQPFEQINHNFLIYPRTSTPDPDCPKPESKSDYKFDRKYNKWKAPLVSSNLWFSCQVKISNPEDEGLTIKDNVLSNSKNPVTSSRQLLKQQLNSFQTELTSVDKILEDNKCNKLSLKNLHLN